MTLVSVQKPQRHFRRGPPNLQIRAPEGDPQERRQDQAQKRAEVVERLAGEQRRRETASGTRSVRDSLNVGTIVF